jgi:hypothetical protein
MTAMMSLRTAATSIKQANISAAALGSSMTAKALRLLRAPSNLDRSGAFSGGFECDDDDDDDMAAGMLCAQQ